MAKDHVVEAWCDELDHLILKFDGQEIGMRVHKAKAIIDAIEVALRDVTACMNFRCPNYLGNLPEHQCCKRVKDEQRKISCPHFRA